MQENGTLYTVESMVIAGCSVRWDLLLTVQPVFSYKFDVSEKFSLLFRDSYVMGRTRDVGKKE